MNNFKLFLKKNNLVQTLISYVIATKVGEVFNSLIDDIIMPIINRDGDNDGIADSDKFKNLKLKILSIDFKIGNFIFIFLKFIFLIFITYKLANILDFTLS
tara:strand:+ start:1360 stop:1662 length:303 start_codon:yes stop_codon:yes gene_type:complete